MKRTLILAALSILLALPCLTFAQDDYPIHWYPQEPTDHDSLTVIIYGYFRDSSPSIEDVNHQQDRNHLETVISVFQDLEGYHTPMGMPWEVAHNWGNLEPGDYTIDLIIIWEDSDGNRDSWSEEAEFSVHESEELEIRLELRQGWNLISFYIEPAESDIRSILNPLVENEILNRVVDARGRFFLPEFNFNNIPAWNANEGYYVNVAEDAELTVEGFEISADRMISLKRGWNSVAYLPEEEIEAPEAFRYIEYGFIVAKDGEGRYYSLEYRYCDMQPLQRGQGYLVKVYRDTGFIWNTERENEH
jgi:hypothetical protein